MVTEFTKVQPRYGHWRLYGYKRIEKVYEAVLPGNMTDAQVTTLVQRLACRDLTEDEIVGASLRKNKKSTLLDVQLGRGGPNSRHTISCGHTVSYIAGYWKAGEPVPGED
jgi:hypothetical protein